MVGESYTPAQLAALLLRDRSFYDTSGGGVTLSGGEVMVQDMDFLLALLRPLKRQGVHVAIDTCGYASYERFERILPYADLFLYDIKMADPALHRRYTGVDNALIVENARRLSQAGAHIHVRVPTIPGVNAGDDEMRAIIALVQREIHAEQINLLPYHKVGQDKAAHLKDAPASESFVPPTAERMEEIKKMWLDAGFINVHIGG